MRKDRRPPSLQQQQPHGRKGRLTPAVQEEQAAAHCCRLVRRCWRPGVTEARSPPSPKPPLRSAPSRAAQPGPAAPQQSEALQDAGSHADVSDDDEDDCVRSPQLEVHRPLRSRQRGDGRRTLLDGDGHVLLTTESGQSTTRKKARANTTPTSSDSIYHFLQTLLLREGDTREWLSLTSRCMPWRTRLSLSDLHKEDDPHFLRTAATHTSSARANSSACGSRMMSVSTTTKSAQQPGLSSPKSASMPAQYAPPVV